MVRVWGYVVQGYVYGYGYGCVWVCYICWKCVVDKDVVNVREIYFMYELWGHVRVWACMGYVYFIYELWGHVRVWGRMGYG